MPMWLCRAGRYGEFENKFLEDNRVYCTWDNLSESIMQFPTKQDLQQYFVDNNPDVKVKTAMNWASQVWPFAHEMKKGEIVVLPSKIKPVIHFGKIMGDYEFLPNNDNPYYHAHQVDWFACDIPRTAFDQDILYSFGAFMTICRIKQEDRIKAVINAHKQGKKAPQITPQEPQDDEEARDIENEALGVITNLIIQKTKGHGLAKIVDAILRAKGFTTYVSPAGPDKGVDILASAGTLGFGSPKICVQVKSTDAPVDRIVLDQLGGVMKNFGAEYGLLVSWSGFKSSVINETASNGEVTATLYYQPVISAVQFENDLTLFRTTKPPAGNPDYYTPDFVLKFASSEDDEEYAIFDAKFSSRANIKKHSLPEVIRKYSCEISAASRSSAPKMVWVLQGRVNGSENAIWKYHNSQLASTYRPITSFGIVSINTAVEIRQRLWNEIRSSISLLQ